MKKNINFTKLLLMAILLISPVFAATNDEIREQAKILYIGSKPQEAQSRILEIPINERIAADYFLIGNTVTDKKVAIQAYEKSINLDEKFYQSYYNLGLIYLGVENYQKAEEYLKSSVKYNKKFAYGHYNLGCIYLKKEQYHKAKSAFEESIRLKPDEADFYYNLGYTYKKLENPKRAEKAVNLYNELIKKRNEN